MKVKNGEKEHYNTNIFVEINLEKILMMIT